MQHRTLMLVSVFSMMTPGFAFATCDDVYRDATRDLFRSKSRASAYFSLYDNLCTSTGEVSSSASESSINLGYGDLSLDFGGSGKSARQTVETFCRDYRATRYADSYRDVASSKVVVEALQNYNVCRKAELDAGVSITHSFVPPDGLIFSFNFANPTQFVVVDDLVMENFDCGTTASKDGKRIELTGERHEFRSNFSIVCERSFADGKSTASAGTDFQQIFGNDIASNFVKYSFPPIPASADASEPAGNRMFPAGSVGVATNFGAYTVSMPADEQYPNSLASEATAKLSEAATTIETLRNEREQLSRSLNSTTSALAGTTSEPHFVVIGEHPRPLARHFGCGTTWETAELQLCGDRDRNRIKILGNFGGHRCGYGYALISCLNIPN